ncbi:hypothetical protein [Proteiniphilum sp.]|uniref:hypothetical protein n=1 Tax=Proteiniphilum sp. TaxID=1926877 RepID=UPI002B1FFADE|nr:hypothetical protein [Proteiniphilum sp.]MEA4918128.1 hypothetical protein [Proteiniphilum sp.]
MNKKETKKEVTERIKTFEDAQAATGRPDVPEFSDVPEDMRDYFKAQYKMVVITEALNEGWKADWSDSSQAKYYPWFYVSSSGFAFDGTDCDFSFPAAGCGSRLCFKTRALAEYAGRQFVQIWDDLTQK